MENRFPEQAESDLKFLVDEKSGDRMNKTFIELGYCKISCLTDQLFAIIYI